MKSLHARIEWFVVGTIALSLAGGYGWWRFGRIVVWERYWGGQLRTIRHPDEMQKLFDRDGAAHSAGDYAAQTNPDGSWVVAVSASSCGRDNLPDRVLIRDSVGRMYRISGGNIHCCGRYGIPQVIGGIFEPTLDGVHQALAQDSNCTRIQ